MTRPLRRYADALVDLLLPRECIGCGTGGPVLCRSCRTAVGPVRSHRPDPEPAGFPACWSAGSYDGPLRAAIVALKEHGRRDLLAELATMLTRSAEAAARALPGDRPVLVVPVPSTAAAAAERGGDHLRRLARAVTLEPAPPVALVLAVRRGASDAGHLDAAQRARSRRTAFLLHRDSERLLGGTDVVLLDDVVTTGWTLAVCAGLLRQAGVRHVHAATIAATQRHRTPVGPGQDGTGNGRYRT